MASTDILGFPTLTDIMNEYSSMDPSGVYLKSAQVLDRACPILKVLPMIKSNQIISNVGSRDSQLGTISAKALGAYTTPTATASIPYTDPIALFEDYGNVSLETYKIQNNPDQWRFNQDRRKIEGISQSLEYALIYDSIASNAAGINGLATRFASSTSRPNSDTSWPYNVYLAGGSGSDTTSIWLIEPGEDKVYLIYPSNIPQAGLIIRNLGEQTETSSTGTKRQVLTTHLQWFVGLAIGDERCVQRIANNETTGASNTFDPLTLIEARNNLPSKGAAPGTCILCNRTIATQMDKLAVDKSNGYFTQDGSGDIFGRPVTRFQGIPVLTADKIGNTETAIS
jgi:hypothetical protein